MAPFPLLSNAASILQDVTATTISGSLGSSGRFNYRHRLGKFYYFEWQIGRKIILLRLLVYVKIIKQLWK